MGDIVKLTLILLIVSSIAGFTIALTYNQTKEMIDEQKAKTQQNALEQVFPKGTIIEEDNSATIIDDTYWIGKNNNQIIGYAFKGSNTGYSSDIKFIVGVDFEGTIFGLTVMEQLETPGLGTRTQEVVSKKYIWNGLFSKEKKDTPWFTKQFSGINIFKKIEIDKAKEWHKMADDEKSSLMSANKISGLTGATISTYAVSSGVKKCAASNLVSIKKNTAKAENTIDIEKNTTNVDTTETVSDSVHIEQE